VNNNVLFFGNIHFIANIVKLVTNFPGEINVYLRIIKTKFMKKLLFISVLFLLSLVACTTDNQDQSQAPELVSVDNTTQSNIVAILSEIAQSNNTTDFVRYDLTIDENGNISTTNRRTIKRTKHSEAYWGFQKQTNSVTIKLNARGSGGIMVCCTLDGENYTCETCPSGAGQTLCVAQLVIDCVESGGCSVTCQLPIIFDSLKNEFYIIKK